MKLKKKLILTLQQNRTYIIIRSKSQKSLVILHVNVILYFTNFIFSVLKKQVIFCFVYFYNYNPFDKDEMDLLISL